MPILDNFQLAFTHGDDLPHLTGILNIIIDDLYDIFRDFVSPPVIGTPYHGYNVCILFPVDCLDFPGHVQYIGNALQYTDLAATAEK